MSEYIEIVKDENPDGTNNVYRVRVIAEVTFEAPEGMSEKEVYEHFRQSINTNLEMESESSLEIWDVVIDDFLGIEQL